MKLISWTIAFYLLSLALAPMLASVGLLSEAFCCEESLADSDVDIDDTSTDEDYAMGCNPFVSCHCCVGFTIPQSKTLFQSVLTTKVEGVAEKPSIASYYIHLVWHPPKETSFSCS